MSVMNLGPQIIFLNVPRISDRLLGFYRNVISRILINRVGFAGIKTFCAVLRTVPVKEK